MTERAQDLILVTGATGKTGRRVAARLEARGVPVRAASRGAVPSFDWEDRATWAAALDGVRAVYVAYAPDLAVPGAAETVGAFARQAVAAGVERIVLLSGRGEAAAEAAEREVRAAGADWTIVRAAWFMQNFSEGAFRDLVLAGEVALPVGDVPEPFVDLDDVADVAVAALTESGHAGRLYELTGPRLMTFADAVAEIGAAAGREVAYAPVPLDAFLDALRGDGLPDDAVELLAFLFGELFDGRNARLGDGVERALGRPPRDLAAWARAAAADGAWSAASAEEAAR
ncbi:NAD(P)H-binding protein [Conexibacter arvalis]|uniref:Uncharacterized protein YbjT (DUF2867 family) n=1 Tax=Conexibacter arvalis TaxID=912552 RepID=A0A840IFR8_9ACTN|nr:NAD(P)H-binding protein [Conexibacter arvalis]MBB4662790.1 uncharacterized protein YbjT (DUF2867 family) [Conexibacter arvalis]